MPAPPPESVPAMVITRSGVWPGGRQRKVLHVGHHAPRVDRRGCRVRRTPGISRSAHRVADVLRDAHRAELRPAHRAEVRGLGGFGGQGFVVEFARGVGIQRQRELVVPAKLEARLRQCVVALLRAGVSLGQIGGVRGDLVGDHAVLDVLAVRQAEMLLGCDVAQHRGAGLGDDRGADRLVMWS